jgi:hypothetical protein
MRSLVLALLVACSACDDGQPREDAMVTPDTWSVDSTPSDTMGEGANSDARTDGKSSDAKSDSAPGDGGICINWKDMGLDCCDVCTEIYVTCKGSVKDKLGNALTGKQCLSLCNTSTAGGAYAYVMCTMKVDGPGKCAAATLQACFDKIFR